MAVAQLAGLRYTYKLMGTLVKPKANVAQGM